MMQRKYADSSFANSFCDINKKRNRYISLKISNIYRFKKARKGGVGRLR